MHPSNSKLHPRISIQPLHVSHHCSKWSYSFLGLKAKINCFRKKIFYLNLWVMEDGLVLAWLMSKWWTPWTYFFWSCWHQCPFVRESIIVILSNHILMHLQIDSILVGMFKKETCLRGLEAARPIGQNYWPTFIYKYYINIFS